MQIVLIWHLGAEIVAINAVFLIPVVELQIFPKESTEIEDN